MTRRLHALLALAALSACHNPDGARSDSGAPGALAPVGPAPVVTGTVLDARTGKPISGARVVGPGGLETHSDAQGHFVLRGLALGTEGELVGTTEAGLKGKNHLQALAGGELEVVLYLR